MLLLLRNKADNIRAKILKIIGLQAFLFDKKSGLTSTQVVDAKGVRSGIQHAGSCYDFDGTDDYVNVSAALPSTDLLATDGVSFACWAKAEGGTGSRMLFAHRDAANPLMQLALHDTNGLTAQFRTSDSGIVTSTNNTATQTNWNHYAVVWDFVGDTQKIYANKVLVQTDSITTTGTLTSAKTIIGAFTDNAGATYGGHMNGKMYGSIIKNGLITQAEINAHADNLVMPVGATAFYKMDEGVSSDVALDSSGNNNDSTSLEASGCTLATFHATDPGVTYSWKNQVGYSDGVNQFEYSEDLTNSYWGSFRLTKTFVGETEGIGLTNCEATENNSNGGAVSKGLTGGYATAGTHTHSIYAKASDSGFLLLRPSDNDDFADRAQAWFNLSTGTTGTVDATGGSFDSATSQITLIGSGLYRCSITFVTNVEISNLSARHYVVNGDDTNSVTIGDSIDMGGAQIQKGVLTAYQKTTFEPTIGVDIPRDESDIEKDTSGNNLDHAGLVKLNADLKGSNCATLDGVDDYGVWTAETDFFDSVYTTFIRMDTGSISTPNRYCLFETGTTYYTISVDIATNGNLTAYAQLSAGGDVRVLSTFAPLQNTSYSVAVRYGDGFLSLFVDGVLVGQTSESGALHPSSILNIGTFRSSNSRFFLGRLYDLRHFTTAVSDADILKIHNKETIAETPVSFPLAEGKGKVSAARDDATKYITWVNATEASLWANTQDVIHSNLLDSFSDGINYIPYSEDETEWKALGSGNPTFSSGTWTFTSGAGNIYFPTDESVNAKLFVGDTTGRTITLSVNLRNVSGENSNYILGLRTADNAEISEVPVTLTGVLQRFQHTYSYTGNASGEILAYIRYSGSSTTEMQVENPQVEESSTATDYQETIGSPTAGQKLPYKINGVYTNPAGEWHNNAETKLVMSPVPSLIQADVGNYLFAADGTPNELSYADLVANVSGSDQIFSDVSVANKKKTFLVFDAPQTGSNLKTALKATKQ